MRTRKESRGSSAAMDQGTERPPGISQGPEAVTTQSCRGRSLGGGPWGMIFEFHPKTPFRFQKSNEKVGLDDQGSSF